MNLHVQQNITIHYMRVGDISNSSVLQIGSAGMIRSQANVGNAGGNSPDNARSAPWLAPLPPPE